MPGVGTPQSANTALVKAGGAGGRNFVPAPQAGPVRSFVGSSNFRAPATPAPSPVPQAAPKALPPQMAKLAGTIAQLAPKEQAVVSKIVSKFLAAQGPKGGGLGDMYRYTPQGLIPLSPLGSPLDFQHPDIPTNPWMLPKPLAGESAPPRPLDIGPRGGLLMRPNGPDRAGRNPGTIPKFGPRIVQQPIPLARSGKPSYPRSPAYANPPPIV